MLPAKQRAGFSLLCFLGESLRWAEACVFSCLFVEAEGRASCGLRVLLPGSSAGR